jgi:ketosteroid isomerase-like protein
MSEHSLRTQVLEGFTPFNEGEFQPAAAVFSNDAVFVAPGASAVAGVYRGRSGVLEFFQRLRSLSGGTLTVEPVEVLANERHMILFLRFRGNRNDSTLDVVVAGFHRDRAPDGWRRATFLPDDQAAFDRFFS